MSPLNLVSELQLSHTPKTKMATKCVPVHSECPDVDTQKAEIHELLQTRYKIGDVW